MLMVVFGAGASYDSAPSLSLAVHRSEPFRPPLANELFEDRVAFARIAKDYKKILPIIPLLRDLKERSVEDVLQGLQDEAKAYPEGQRQMVAVRYYLRDVLWECSKQWPLVAKELTNYRSLLDQIARQDRTADPIVLVTFNYDTLLENALYDYKFRTENILDYINSHEKYKVFKLHGSVNWARFFKTFGTSSVNRHDIIEKAVELQVGDIFTLYGGERRDMIQQVPVLPAIAIPLQKKDVFECPLEHIELLKKMIPKVTSILFIGWRAGEDHFLQMLQEGLTSLRAFMVVAGDQIEAKKVATRIREQLGAAARYATTITGKGGFTDFIVRREGDEFLRG
jgi:hypothetical protein